MKNLKSFDSFNNERLLEKKEKSVSEIEKEEKERWKKLEKEMLEDEKKMKIKAGSDMKKFFDKDKKSISVNKNKPYDQVNTKEIEEEERKKWKKLEKDMLEDEKRMKRDAEKDMKTFFKKIKRDTSTHSSSSNYDSRQMGKREISDLHYSSQYKAYKPKTVEELKRLLSSGKIIQVKDGVYHFSVKENGVKKYFFRFI